MFEGIKLRKLQREIQLQMLKKAVEIVESLPEFAKDRDENEWQALSTGKEKYSEEDLQGMREQARKLYDTNPIATGIIERIIDFTIGKTCKINPVDPDEKVREYWNRFCKENKFDMKMKEIVRRTLRDGECFIRFFEPKNPEGVPAIRFVEPEEIKSDKYSYGIETDPDDIETVLRYYREYTTSNGKIEKETIDADEMIHVKIRVDSNVKRGLSFYTGIAKWIVKYTDWLEDRMVLNKIRTLFNLVAKPAGTPEEAIDAFPDANKKGDDTEYKKLPKRGSILFSTGIDWEFKNLNINAADTKDDGRAVLLMIVAGTRLAEYMVTGDASNANYASTMVSESPAVKAFEAWQDFFEKVFKQIYEKVITYGLEKNILPQATTKKKITYDEETGEEKIEEETTPTSIECKIDFPILIHRNIKEETEALQIQRANRWVSDKTAMGKLGYDWREEKKQLRIEDKMEGGE